MKIYSSLDVDQLPEPSGHFGSTRQYLTMNMMMTQMHLDDDRDDDPAEDPEDNPYDHSPFSVPISVYSASQLLHSGTCKIDSKPSVTRLSSTCLIRTITTIMATMQTGVFKGETFQQLVLSGQSQSPGRQLEHHLKL